MCIIYNIIKYTNMLSLKSWEVDQLVEYLFAHCKMKSWRILVKELEKY